jgi:hypothetical protein
MCNKLFRLKLNKYVAPDGLSNKILKHLLHILSAPLASIINCSLRQGIVPELRKIVGVTPLPKSIPACTAESDFVTHVCN